MTDEFDVNALVQQAMAMQQSLASAQAAIAAQTVEGYAGGRSVVVTMTGGGEVTAVRIAPEVVAPADTELLEDLIVAAIHDAQGKVMAMQQQAIGPLAGGLGGLLGT